MSYQSGTVVIIKVVSSHVTISVARLVAIQTPYKIQTNHVTDHYPPPGLALLNIKSHSNNGQEERASLMRGNDDFFQEGLITKGYRDINEIFCSGLEPLSPQSGKFKKDKSGMENPIIFLRPSLAERMRLLSSNEMMIHNKATVTDTSLSVSPQPSSHIWLYIIRYFKISRI